ncbi:transposase, partial [Paenactinomyces guangxiensis]|nr:transposase [Paenactinomyces guangxiensis]MBH8593714.1 transposase [Paenactinomyces guangxiensis]
MLEQRKTAYKHHGITLNYNKQATELPSVKKECPEFKEIHSQVLQDVAKRLQKAFDAF